MIFCQAFFCASERDTLETTVAFISKLQVTNQPSVFQSLEKRLPGVKQQENVRVPAPADGDGHYSPECGREEIFHFKANSHTGVVQKFLLLELVFLCTRCKIHSLLDC